MGALSPRRPMALSSKGLLRVRDDIRAREHELDVAHLLLGREAKLGHRGPVSPCEGSRGDARRRWCTLKLNSYIIYYPYRYGDCVHLHDV